MTHEQALELADFVEGLSGCESCRIRPARLGGGWAVTVRMVGVPPRTFTYYSAAFVTYCGGSDEEN